MNSRTLLRTLALGLGLMAGAGAGPLASQPSAPRSPPSESRSSADAGDEARELIGEMQQIQQQLVSIQEKALASDLEVQAQARRYQETLLGAMRADGFDAMQSLKHIEAIERQIETETLNEQEREGLLAEVREEEQRLTEAEQAALRHQEVQQVREQLMQGLLTAMREQEPQTDRLIEQLEQKNTQLRSIISAEAPQAR